MIKLVLEFFFNRITKVFFHDALIYLLVILKYFIYVFLQVSPLTDTFL